MLAESRLEHMTQLYETGRWRRYFSEEKFLEIVRETAAAAEVWRKLASGQPSAEIFALPAEPAFVRTPTPPSPFAIAEPQERQRSVA